MSANTQPGQDQIHELSQMQHMDRKRENFEDLLKFVQTKQEDSDMLNFQSGHSTLTLV